MADTDGNLYYATSNESLQLSEFRGLDRYGRLWRREERTKEFAKEIRRKFPNVEIIEIMITSVLLRLAGKDEQKCIQKIEEECNCSLVRHRPITFFQK